MTRTVATKRKGASKRIPVMKTQLVALLVNAAQTVEGIRSSTGDDEIRAKAQVVVLGLLRQAEALVGS